tara:strand:- start:44 stop:208 length:165 start_codon:yes stop_codon:yes gene_type:complete
MLIKKIERWLSALLARVLLSCAGGGTDKTDGERGDVPASSSSGGGEGEGEGEVK